MVQDAGPPDGLPVLVYCGSPGSRHLSPGALHQAGQKGLRPIGVDPPGYGGSTAQPGRSVADGAADASAIARALAIPKLAAWASPVAAPLPWPARPCFPTWSSPSACSLRSARTASPGWTSCAASARTAARRHACSSMTAREHGRTSVPTRPSSSSGCRPRQDGWTAGATRRRLTPRTAGRWPTTLPCAAVTACATGIRAGGTTGRPSCSRGDSTSPRSGCRCSSGTGSPTPQCRPPTGGGRRPRFPASTRIFPAGDDHATIEAAHRGQAYDWLLARA